MDLDRVLDASQLYINRTHYHTYRALERAMTQGIHGARLVDEHYGTVPKIITLFMDNVVKHKGDGGPITYAYARSLVQDFETMKIIGRPDHQQAVKDFDEGFWYVRIPINFPSEEDCPVQRRFKHTMPVELIGREPQGTRDRHFRPIPGKTPAVPDCVEEGEKMSFDGEHYIAVRCDLFDHLMEQMSDTELTRYYESRGVFAHVDMEAAVSENNPPFHMHYTEEGDAGRDTESEYYPPSETGWRGILMFWIDRSIYVLDAVADRLTTRS